MKTCSKCGIERPLDDFYRQANCAGGFRPDCKDCVRLRAKQNRQNNIDSARARDNARYRDDPVRRESAKRRARERYAANREAEIVKRREHYQANREKYAAYARKRKAALRGVEHSPYTRREIYDRDGGRCRMCQRELSFAPNSFDIDHIVPISLGGPDTPANLQLSCRRCNRKKWSNLEGQIHMPV